MAKMKTVKGIKFDAGFKTLEDYEKDLAGSITDMKSSSNPAMYRAVLIKAEATLLHVRAALGKAA